MKDLDLDSIPGLLPSLVRANGSSAMKGWLENITGNVGFVMIAGPCRVESEDQIDDIASFLSSRGVKFLRAGAFKPMTFPTGTAPLGLDGLKILQAIGQKYGLKIVSEIMDPRHVEECAPYLDVIQIGARNMQNYDLLAEAGSSQVPILLKRHPGASLRDWLGAGEWICSRNNDMLMLCERGVSTPHTHEPNARWLLDITSPLAVSEIFPNIPVIMDPSHACGVRRRVKNLTLASKAVGAAGAIVEVHYDPDSSLSDPLQAINYATFDELLAGLGEQ